jgi:poly(A)-specific ribonuclease
MEVDANSFPYHLLEMLVAISEAEFVSFDLELTGIPSRLPGKIGKPRNGERSTLEDRYLEAKAGAERYHILQFGFTCARFDYLANHYVLKPYNVNISPLLDERLDIEREVSFQTGAISFLLSHGFDFHLPFTKGVQYLSKEEAHLAKQMAYDRLDKKTVIEDLQLKETEVDSLDFMRRVREAIKEWKAGNSLSLDITTHTGMPEQPAVSTITRFEKRLVHQLVRAEYPDLVSMGRSDCIKIINYDEEREADNTRRLKNRVKESIARQIGFRWIIEALTGGKIDSINPIYLAKNSSGDVIAADLGNIKNRLRSTAMRLHNNQPILVGHNMFTDLIYLYRTFIGDLPETLPEFCEAMHELFPRIVDTKYLATHDGGDLNASPTLQEIAEGLESQPLPDIGQLNSLFSPLHQWP